MARLMEMPMLATMATSGRVRPHTRMAGSAGAKANRRANRAAAADAQPTRRSMPPMFFCSTRMPRRAPRKNPMSAHGSVTNCTTPRACSSRPSDSYLRLDSRPNPTRAGTRNGSAEKMRRMLCTFWIMRQASASEGGASSVSMTSSLAPMARRSWAPRVGSTRRAARNTRISVGTMNTTKGHRHPSQPPIRPPSRPPRDSPMTLAERWNE